MTEQQINDGGPAFPQIDALPPGYFGKGPPAPSGMSLREYAAIKLRVPNSGSEWLDDMIRESLRMELAAKAMQGLLSGLGDSDCGLRGFVSNAYLFADAMLAKREKGRTK